MRCILLFKDMWFASIRGYGHSVINNFILICFELLYQKITTKSDKKLMNKFYQNNFINFRLKREREYVRTHTVMYIK